VTGAPVLVDDSNWLNAFLERLVQKYESSRNQPWAYSPPADFHTAMVSQIVGFEMPIETIEGKFKLSQNRSQQDQAGVIAGLESEGGSQVASLMRERQ
jgi:transcriptional regulator